MRAVVGLYSAAGTALFDRELAEKLVKVSHPDVFV
jgi:hypothetical protein